MAKYRILKDPENIDKPFFIQKQKRFLWKKYWSDICEPIQCGPYGESTFFEKKRFETQPDAERYVQRCLDDERPLEEPYVVKEY